MKTLNTLFERVDSNIEAAEKEIDDSVIIIDDISGDMERLDVESLEEYIDFLIERVAEGKEILKKKKETNK